MTVVARAAYLIIHARLLPTRVVMIMRRLDTCLWIAPNESGSIIAPGYFRYFGADGCEVNFHKLKIGLTTAAVLTLPIVEGGFTIYYDESRIILGCVIMQNGECNTPYPRQTMMEILEAAGTTDRHHPQTVVYNPRKANVVYNPRKANVVVHALSRKSMGSFAWIDSERASRDSTYHVMPRRVRRNVNENVEKEVPQEDPKVLTDPLAEQVTNSEFLAVFQVLSQGMTTQANRNDVVPMNSNFSTTTTRLRNFTKMNLPDFHGSKVQDDPQ
ncbi:hypothetical protein MTR67_017839 [Solanum verrucosum]|uniref:Uncharacterized protein n=1 Tax=Solanum verrucosum TaxID=315347 RepID=A0AAF0QR34_SOLVR|nr:hypothetical protein MTR67_017839 [Solanum verrucosum]